MKKYNFTILTFRTSQNIECSFFAHKLIDEPVANFFLEIISNLLKCFVFMSYIDSPNKFIEISSVINFNCT